MEGRHGLRGAGLGREGQKTSLVHHSLANGLQMRVSKGWEFFGSKPKDLAESKEPEFGDVSRSSDLGVVE